MTHNYVTRPRWAVFLFCWLAAFGAAAQSSQSNFNLYEQTSEVAGLVIRYAQDVRAVNYFYGPMPAEGRGQRGGSALASPEQRKRLREVDNDYLAKLGKVDFNAMSIYGKVDYLLLKRNIDDHLLSLSQEEKEYAQIERYIPFAAGIYELEKGRRRGATVDGQAVAAKLNDLQKEVKKAEEAFKKLESLDMPLSRIGAEAVNGLEQMKWTGPEMDMVTYDVTMPFIRMVAGSVDYTQGAMRNATKRTHRGINDEPMSQGTRCRQLAEYVVFESPLNMLCDSPDNYEKEAECTAFIADVPTVWDRTISLDGAIGQCIAIARQKGDQWYLGGLTNWEARNMEIDLSFLGAGDFTAEVFRDGVNANRIASDYKKEIISIPSSRKMTLKMAQGGGFALKIYRKKNK